MYIQMSIILYSSYQFCFNDFFPANKGEVKGKKGKRGGSGKSNDGRGSVSSYLPLFSYYIALQFITLF